MCYADHLKRSMDRLTIDAWERLLTSGPPARTTSKTFLTSCPCCQASVVVDMTVTLLPVSIPPAPAADPDDILSSGISDDTQLELAALTRTDLVLA